MMFDIHKLKSVLFDYFINIPGWHTNRHIVVIESDDWGSVRMPSREVYDEFMRRGIRVDRDSYCKYDRLETADDLVNLYEVLQSVKDKNGHPAVLTADTVVANPDFGKIRESGFKEYYYEPLTQSYKNSPCHQGVFNVWNQGIEAGIFHPQLHGRDHVNVKKWMKMLRSGDELTRIAFDFGTFGLTSAVDPSIKRNYMGAFFSELPEDIESYKTIIKEGAALFEEIFGFTSESFIAPYYTMSPKLETVLSDVGVKYLQGIVKHVVPHGDDYDIVLSKNNFQGVRRDSGLIFLMRNASFEPTEYPGKDTVGECMRSINIAFKRGKAAVICAHRLNFIGSIDKSNTDRTLPMFRELLSQIVKTWPDVEFMSSDQLGNVIEKSI